MCRHCDEGDADRVCAEEHEQAFPLILLPFPAPSGRDIRDVLRELAAACFPGATDEEARERAEKAKGKGAVVPF